MIITLGFSVFTEISNIILIDTKVLLYKPLLISFIFFISVVSYKEASVKTCTFLWDEIYAFGQVCVLQTVTTKI